jgi:hypothetical protein
LILSPEVEILQAMVDMGHCTSLSTLW